MEEQCQKRADRFFKHCLKIKKELEAPDETISVCEEKLEEWEFPPGEERMIAAWYLAGNQEGKDIDAICKDVYKRQADCFADFQCLAVCGFYGSDDSGIHGDLYCCVQHDSQRIL